MPAGKLQPAYWTHVVHTHGDAVQGSCRTRACRPASRTHLNAVHPPVCDRNPVRRFLEDMRVPPNEWLLHNGASSVLGRELICMAKRRGTKLINVVRRREAVNELKDLGCASCPRCCLHARL